MPWALAIEAQRACLGRQKASSNIFYVFFFGLVCGFAVLCVVLCFCGIQFPIHKSMPCSQEHGTWSCSELRIEVMH